MFRLRTMAHVAVSDIFFGELNERYRPSPEYEGGKSALVFGIGVSPFPSQSQAWNYVFQYSLSFLNLNS